MKKEQKKKKEESRGNERNKNNDHNAANDTMDEKNAKLAYYLLAIFTIVHLMFIVSVSFGGPEIGRSWTKIYLVVLGAIIGAKRIRYFVKDNSNKSRGEYFFYLVLIVTVALFIVKWLTIWITGNPEFRMSTEIWPTILGVAAIFFGAKILKSAGVFVKIFTGTGNGGANSVQ